MKRLCLVICALCLGLGCASEGSQGQWDEFWKDVRGENMQMRGGFSDMSAADSKPSQKNSN